MATSRVSDNSEVNSNYATHVALTASLLAALRRLWPEVDGSDLARSFSRIQAAAAALVGEFSRASISLNADHFEAMRELAGVSGRFSTPVIDPLDDAALRVYLGAVVDDGVAGLEGAAQKLVMDAGRNELIAAIEADTEARGYARVTKPGACAFCLMLATRGAVYKSRETAGGESQYHANCHCTVEPLFGRHYEPPAHIRAAGSLWSESTEDFHGSKAKLNAFRRALGAQQGA